MKELGAISHPWNQDTVSALGLYRLVSRILGAWPLECHDFASNVRFVVVITLQLVLSYDLIQEFVRGCVPTINVVDLIGLLGSIFVSLVKIAVIRIYRKEMFSVVNSAVRDCLSFRDEKSRRTMLDHSRYGRFVLLLQLYGAMASMVICFILNQPTFEKISHDSPNLKNVTTVRKMPLTSGCSVTHSSMLSYFVLYVLQNIEMACFCLCSIGYDSLLFGFAMHLCGQLEILKMDIARLGQSVDHHRVRGEFAALIDRHNSLTGLVDLLEAIFHPIILVQMATTTVHLSLIGIEIVCALRDGNYAVIAFSSTVVVELLLQIYLYSYAGEYLSSQIMEIRDAAYNCSWYDWSPSLTKDVMFVIVQTHRPFYLTAGKIYRMNNESFTSFVKSMASFYSVLKLTIVG